MARKILGITMLWMVVTLTIPPLGFSADLCNQAKKDFVSAEKEWSSVNADITFLRDELEKLRSLRWETKTTLSVIEDASRLLKKNSSLTDAQRMTLNARIPSGRGTIDPKGMFAMTGAEGKPLKLDEARDMLRRVLKEAEGDIAKTEKELTDMEKKSHRLSQELDFPRASRGKEMQGRWPADPLGTGTPESLLGGGLRSIRRTRKNARRSCCTAPLFGYRTTVGQGLLRFSFILRTCVCSGTPHRIERC